MESKVVAQTGKEGGEREGKVRKWEQRRKHRGARVQSTQGRKLSCTAQMGFCELMCTDMSCAKLGSHELVCMDEIL